MGEHREVSLEGTILVSISCDGRAGRGAVDTVPIVLVVFLGRTQPDSQSLLYLEGSLYVHHLLAENLRSGAHMGGSGCAGRGWTRFCSLHGRYRGHWRPTRPFVVQKLQAPEGKHPDSHLCVTREMSRFQRASLH